MAIIRLSASTTTSAKPARYSLQVNSATDWKAPMNEQFDFSDLFVFDLANNHQGNVQHALNIIGQIGEVVRRQTIRGVFKFQFRQLDSFVHPAHQKQSDNKHIPRFLATRLGRPEFQTLLDAVRAEGMLAMCTPFDEESVDVITDMDFDLIKVASCSAKDWPLLEKIAQANIPVIFSTGGLQLSNIDDLVSFFDHRGSDFAIMHCVGEYPTPDEHMHLSQIDFLRARYPNVRIGFSTHEDPDATDIVQMAIAKGITLFEKHVGLPTASYPLNAYSASPEQVRTWLQAAHRAWSLCGIGDRRLPPNPEEAFRKASSPQQITSLPPQTMVKYMWSSYPILPQAEF